MTTPKQEKRFDYKGFPCVILFMLAGYRCGYVGIPKKSKYYRKSYGDIPVNCHCGLTYADQKLFHQADKSVWWIEFDCGHACDGYDVSRIKELYADDESVMKQVAILERTTFFDIFGENPVRTVEYCEEQCKGIVEQLIEIESEKEE